MMSTPSRPRLRALPWLVALALAMPPASAGVEAESSTDVAFVVFELGEEGNVAADELLGALLPLGADVTRDVIAALGSAYVPGADGRPRRLDRRRREELSEAMTEVPTLVLRLELGGELDTAARTPAVEVALAIVGELGRGDQLSTAFALAETAIGERLDRRVARALEVCLVRLLGRHPEAHARLGSRFRDVQPALRWTVLRAVGEARQREGFGFFAAVIGEHPELEMSTLTEVGRLAAVHRPPHDWSFKLRLRSYLGSTHPGLRREAAGTMARLEDRESFGAIVELLSDTDRGVRDNALWAARQLSGKGFGAEPEAWQRWYGEQMSWWSERAPELIARLTRNGGPERLQGLGELVSRPLFRHDVAKELSRVLTRGEDAVLMKSTCSALADLGSPVALPALIEVLEHPERPVREQAWQALLQITGEELPPEPALWGALLP